MVCSLKKELPVTLNILRSESLTEVHHRSWEFQKVVLVMDRLDVIKIGKWGCRLGVREKYRTGNRVSSELQRSS